jgi:hypothetical protein
MSKNVKKPESEPKRPEHTIKLPGALKITIWRNEYVRSDGEVRQSRSLTITRRYKDRRTGQWADAKSFRAKDLPVILYGLQVAQHYFYTTPLTTRHPEPEQE